MLTFVLCAMLLVGGVVSQTTTHKPHAPRPTVVYPDLETELTNRGHYTVLLDLIRTAGLMDTLKAADKLTLFAPTDDAFAQISASDLSAIKNDPQRLTYLLGYHVTTEKGFRLHGQFQDRTFNSYNNLPIRLNIYRVLHVISAEGVNITERDIHIKNGFVQGLAGVMRPPTGDVVDILSGRGDMTTLTSLINQAGLVGAIKADYNITVFAPSDEAFRKVSSQVLDYLASNDKQLSETLLFHIVKRLTLYSIGMKHSMTFPSADQHHDKLMLLEDNNGDAFINHAKITEKDISATNGVIHVIDDVLIPYRVLVAAEDLGIVVG